MGASQSSYDDEYDANDEYNEETEEMPVKVSVAWRGLTPKISPALMERIAEYMDDQKKESEESPQEEEEEQEAKQKREAADRKRHTAEIPYSESCTIARLA